MSASTGSKAPDPRRRAEIILVQSIMGRVQAATKDVVADRRAGDAAANLTAAEQPVFSKYTYYGWKYGVPAGVAVFGVIFGGLRFAAYRQFVKARALPSSSTYHARTSASRQQYAALDRPGTAGTQPIPPAPSSSSAIDSYSVFSNDTMVQVQFMVSAAVSLFVGIVTCNLTVDRDQFYRDLSVVPLQPGKSVLCHRMCPQIIRQRNELLAMTTMQPLYEQHLREKQQRKEGSPSTQQSANDAESLSPFVQAILQLNPMELWEDPVTEDLDSMVVFVQNCQHRMEFEEECRRRNYRVDEATGLVDVPKPGVPMRYHKSSGEA